MPQYYHSLEKPCVYQAERFKLELQEENAEIMT